MTSTVLESRARPQTSPFLDLHALPAPFHVVFTTRIAGTSCGDYDSLNMALHVGDDPGCVRENRRLVCEAWGLPHEKLVLAEQVHGRQVAHVDSYDAGRGALTHLDSVRGADALITRQRRMPLMSLSADCLLLAIGDSATCALAVVHAGWRGLAGGVIENTLAAMFAGGAQPETIHVVGGPCIGRCCFETRGDVAQALGRENVTHTTTQKFMLDLRRAALARLFNCGVSEARVTLDPTCTCCREDLFFSHRRQTRQGKQPCGRMALMAWIE